MCQVGNRFGPLRRTIAFQFPSLPVSRDPKGCTHPAGERDPVALWDRHRL